MARVAMPLAISEQAVHEVFLSQPKMRMSALELTALFAPASHDERLRLTRAACRVAELTEAVGPSGEPIVQLLAPPALAAPAAVDAPLPLEPLALRALLLAQPQREMAADALRAHFAPANESERCRLVALISEVGELVEGADGKGPQIRLRGAQLRPPSSEAGSGCGTNGGADEPPHKAITPVERELVRRMLATSPSGTMRVDELVRKLAPPDPSAKRRLANVLAEVAKVCERPDGSGGVAPYLVLRDATNDESGGGGAANFAQGGGAGKLPPRACSASTASSVRWRESSVGGSTVSWAAPSAFASASGGGPPPSAPRQEGGPTALTEEGIVELLRAAGGRLPSHALIARTGARDGSAKRALAGIVRRVCRTQLCEGGGATVVLREALLAERVRCRAATSVQRHHRRRQAASLAAVGAAICLQAALRRAIAVRRAWWCRTEANAATVLQQAARTRALVRAAHWQVAAARAAVLLQMAARRWQLSARVARRAATHDAAATVAQAGWRRVLGARGAAAARRAQQMACETDEERCVREAAERNQLLRQKLLRRKRQQQQRRPQQPELHAATQPMVQCQQTSSGSDDAPGGNDPRCADAAPATAAEAEATMPTDPARAPSREVQCAPLPPALDHLPPPHGQMERVGARARWGSARAVAMDAADASRGQSTTVHATGEDFMAAIRRMMAEHGAGGDDE